MAYLSPAYEHDVFVSYSHGDPRGTGQSPLRTWSLALIEALEAEILAVEPDLRDLDLWCDRDLDPTLNLTDELRRKVERAAILMILMSPHYLESQWCGDERAWFEAQVAARAGETGRVFVVRAVSTNDGDWPSFLRDERGHAILGFRFHRPPKQPGDRETPFGWPNLIERDEPCRKALAILRTALTRRLRELKLRAAGAAAPRETATQTGILPRIYVYVRPEHDAIGREVKAVLERLGCAVTAPILAPSSRPDDWIVEQKARIYAARQCDALALLRPTADGAFVGDLLDIGVDERERIYAERGTPLPCAVLDGSGAPLEMDVSDFGIERFELRNSNWPKLFLAWLGRAASG